MVLSDDKTKVEFTTEYVDVEESEVDKSLAGKITSLINKHFGGSESEGIPLIKQFQEDEMIAIEPLYIAIGDVDGVGDTYASPDVCHEMVKSFNKAIDDGKMKGNYFHKVDTDDFTILKAWVTETDCIIGDTEVKEGMSLVKVQFVNEQAWELRKSNELKGVSIGAKATWENVDE